jgi:ABC-type amino acid transport substrate-binding protein
MSASPASPILALLALPALAASQDLPAIQKAGAIRVIVDTSNMPERFNLASGGEPGLEKEVLLGFASLHRLRLEVVLVERPDDRLAHLKAGKGDVVAGIVATESRRRQAAFTATVLPNRHVVVSRRPGAVVSTLEELRARRVGAMRGSSWADEARAAGVPAAQLEDSYPTPEAMLDGLRGGRVSAVVMTVVWAVLAQKADPDLQIGLFLGQPSDVAFAVRKESPGLHKALDDYVSNLRQTATWSRLIVKYFGDSGLEILRKARVD